MSIYPDLLEQLIDGLSDLPGIGRRSAERIALYLIDSPGNTARRLSELIAAVKDKIKACTICSNFSTEETCSICSNPQRDMSTVCVVEYPKDVIALEKSGMFHGVYYVLMGSISPIEGRGPQNLDIARLLNRVKSGEVLEIIIATDADSEGESTAHFLKNILSSYPVKVSRIGIGVPLGSQIEFTNSATLGKALQERRQM
jgi:recombination protein RecR